MNGSVPSSEAPALVIRSASIADLEAVLALYRHLHPLEPAAPHAGSAWREIVSHPGTTVLLGAMPSGELVTSCTVVVVPNLTRNAAPYALIENVVTHADHRGKGYGKAILRAAVAEADRHGCYKVMLMTGSKRESTLRFYQSAGFSQDKTGFSIRRDRPQPV